MISYRESTFLGSSTPKTHSASTWVKLVCMFALSFLLTQEAAAQLKIMPLGDSITDGDKSSDLGGYRSRLFANFKSSGHRTDFVGGLSGGTGFFDTQHEGHGGFSAEEIRDNALSYLGANPPQAVLLMIGTNDITAGQGVNAIRDEISEALEKIKLFNPLIEIYQATLPRRKDDKQAQATQLNTLIEQLVSTKAGNGMNITLVKIDNLASADLADNVHPNDAGYQKIADKFYNAIIAKHAPSLETFQDDFNRASLGAAWNANSAMKIVSNQLKNTSAVDNFDTFLAIATEITNPRLVSFKYGTGTDAVGRAFSGLTVMIDNPVFNKANGYLIFHNSQDNPPSLRLYEVKNGVASASPIQKITAEAAAPQPGDVFQVEIASDAQGHKFTVTMNGVLDGILRDSDRLQGNASELYAGVQINGNTSNAVDDFFATTAADLVEPDEVTDLKFLSATSSTVTLEFTTTGDDGKIGAASRYDVRYSTGQITANNFNGANPANVTKTPNVSGSVEQVTVSGLEGGVEYFFALKVLDEVGNASKISNVVSGSTALLATKKDDFNRTGPSLGKDWAAGSSMKIVSNTVQNTGASLQAAVLKTRRNAQEVSIMLGPEVNGDGGRAVGVLAMASDSIASPSGYLIRRRFNNNREEVVLYNVVDGTIGDIINSGPSLLAATPDDSSIITVIYQTTDTENIFNVFVDGQLDRILSDPQKRQSGKYAGFMLEPGAAATAIEFFSVAVPIKAATKLTKISGDNQVGQVNQALAEALVVKLNDDDNNPVVGKPVNFEVSPAGNATVDVPPAADGGIRAEAETGVITGPIEIRNDNDASRGKYVVYPLGQSADATVKISFKITKAGNYYIWTRSRKNSLPFGRWSVKIDGGAAIDYIVFDGEARNFWDWDLLSDNTFNLAAGNHTIEFSVLREDTWLDKILLITDPNFTPNGLEDPGFTTDSEGFSSAQIVFGATAGQITISASHASLPTVNFKAQASGGPATAMVLTSGNNLTGPAGQTLTQPFVVTVRDVANNVVAGHKVSWVLTAGDGSLTNYTSTTGIDGRASTTLTLGVTQAAHKVQARSLKTDGTDLGGAIEFTATANTGLPKNLALVSGNNQTAAVQTKLPNDIVVRATDAASNAIVNVPLQINVLRGGGPVAAEASVLNRDFETATGVGFPTNWDAEGSANSTEVKTSTVAPRSGTRSLEVNSARTVEVGVSQAINYAANTNYVLTFYAKVSSGTARVRWELNDASGNTDDNTIDLVRNAANVGWVQYRLRATNGQAGSKRLRFVTDNRGGNFFIDEIRLVPATGNNGRVTTAWTMGDTAMVQQIEFRGIADGTALTGSPIKFSATATAGAAANLEKDDGDNQNGTANQPLPKPLVARVTDFSGVNGVDGVDVKFTVKAGGGKLQGNVNTRTVKTANGGYASSIYTLGANNNVQNEVEITSAGLAGSPQTFISIAAVPGRAAIFAGNNQKGSAGHLVTTPLAVKVFTQDDKALAGYPVIFEVLEGNGTINKQKKDTLLTDNTGVARAPLRNGPTPGAVNKVKASALFNNQPVSGSPFTFTVRTFGLKLIKTESGDAQEGVVGNFLPKPLVVTVQDSANKGIAEQKINFSVTAGGGVFKNNSAAFVATTDTAGQGKAELKLGAQPIDNKVSAAITPALSGSPRLFTAKATVSAPDTLVKVSGDSASGVVGNRMQTPFVVKVTDRFNNGIDGLKVIFKVAGGGGNIDGQQADTINTANGGKAQIFLTLGPTTNGAPYNNIVEARSFNGTIPLRNSPLKFVATATASRARVMTDNGGNRQTDGVAGVALNLPFRVLVKDGVGAGNPVPNHPVKFEVRRGTGKFANGKTDSTVFTGAAGVAQIKLTLGGETLPDSQVVVATSNDGTNPLQGSNMRFVAFANAGNPSQATSNVFSSGSVRADNVTYKDVLIEIKDLFGNPVAGKFVVIEVSNGPNDIIQPNEVTNANGQAFAKFKSSKSGEKIVSAYIPSGIRLTNTASVTFLPLEANRVGLISGNNQKGNLNTAVDQPLIVKVGDKFNNGVPNSEVTFRVHSGPGKMSNGETSMKVTSGTDGQAEAFFIFGTTAGESQIRAEAPGLINSPVIFLANAVNNPAKNLEYVSGNEQEGVAGETLAEPLIVKVTDNTAKAVFNTTVNFQSTFGGGTLSATSVKTNEFGEARVTLKLGEQAGLNAVRVSSDGLDGSPIDFSAQAIGGRPCCIAVQTPRPSGRVAGQSGPVRVIVTDNRGNGIDNYTVQFRLIKGTGSLTRTSVATTGGGIATTFVNFDNTSGYRYVQVIADGLAGSPITIPVYAQAEAAVSMQAVARTNNQGGTVKKTLNFPLQVLFKDQYGNPSLGEGANFVITKGGGYLNGQSNLVSFSTTSDSNGIAQASLTLGAVAGENKVNAIKNGGTQVPALTFTATGFTNNFPVFNDVPDQKIAETGAVEFALSASDQDADGMTFGASNLPPGSAFDSLNTRVFRWQTNYSSAGVYEPAFYVRDGKGGVDIEVVRIEVSNRNRVPRLLSRVPIGFGDGIKPDTTFKEGSDGVGRLKMSVKATDDDPGTTLHYAWYQDGRKVGKDSSGYQFVGLPGISSVLCVITDGEDELKTQWAVKVPVLLSSFSASAEAKGTVTLRWSTTSETYNAGFHVLRSASLNGTYTRITREMILPRRDGNYSFADDEVQAGAKYYYKLEDFDVSGKSTLHGPVEALVTLPEKYDLSQNYPNPFNPSTNIEFQMPKPGRVQLTIYNTLGQKVTRLVNDLREAGRHTVLWNGRDQKGNHVPSGVYHYRLEVDGFVSTKKMVLAK